MKTCEPRRPVLIEARMRNGAAWGDVSILNVSSRGLLIHSAQAPPRGAYLEVRRGRHCIVARVVWAGDQRFGVQTQNPLSVEAIIREPDLSSPGATPSEEQPVERRTAERRRLKERHERSRAAGRKFEFTFMAVAGMAAAITFYSVVEEILTAPLTKATAALARNG